MKFKPGTAASEIGAAHRQAAGNPITTISGIDVQVVQVPAGTVPATVAAYEKNPNVEYAEPDYYRLLVVPQEEHETPLGGDNLFEDQWYLNNTGQSHVVKVQSCHPVFGCTVELQETQGTPDADIDAPEAWDITTGSPTVKIAVLDSGVDCNTLELGPKCDAREDYIDYANEPGIYFDSCAPDNPACDNLGHGTFVASEAAAETNNDEGIAGAGWDARIGVFKVCYQALVTDGVNYYVVGLCSVSYSAQAIADAVSLGHHTITMSYGSDLIDPVTGEITPTDESTAECDAIENAVNAGVLVIAAAGNNGDTTRVYPAACTDSSGESTVIAVAASDHDDDKASFSTYSRDSDDWVSMAAPGEGIIGVLPDAACGLSSAVDTCVEWWDGTSMAAPLVAGASSLIWAYLYGTGVDEGGEPAPDSCTVSGVPCNQVIRERLESGADATGANGQNWLEWTIHGRLNAVNALSVAACVPTEDPEVTCGDGIDNDCDGLVDDADSTNCPIDADGDGYDTTVDCNDADASINPGASEVCGDGIDQDCDGSDEICPAEDADGDGYDSADDCNDADASINPGATEVCDGVDNDCDGTVDEGFDVDGDGYTTCGGDCDDADASVNPGAAEHCSDGIDNNCDGGVDSEDPVCSLLPKGASCTEDAECLSNKCRGRPGSKECK